jgi:hypothetical protein
MEQEINDCLHVQRWIIRTAGLTTGVILELDYFPV